MKPLLFLILYFVGVILTAQIFAPPGYVWTQNTVSELASQGHNQKWIMQAGFIGFGVLLPVVFVKKTYNFRQIHYPDMLILVTSLAILVTGIFCTALYHPSIRFSAQQAQIHSILPLPFRVSLWLVESIGTRSLHLKNGSSIWFLLY